MKIFTKKFTILIAILLGSFGINQAQISFTNTNTVLHSQAGVLGSNASVHSGNTVIVVDIDNNGLDDIAKLDENRYLDIEYQQTGGTFTFADNVFATSMPILAAPVKTITLLFISIVFNLINYTSFII